MRNGNNPGLWRDHFSQIRHDKGTIGTHVESTNSGPCLFRHHLPGNNIGMMLGDADQDFVTRLQPRLGPAACDQIQRHRGPGGENDLVTAGSPDEGCHRSPYRLIGIGRGFGQEMQAAMHVGIGVGVGQHQRIHDLTRFLRRCRTVEIDQRPAMHLARENGKIRPDRIDVIEFCCHLIHAHPHRWSDQSGPSTV